MDACHHERDRQPARPVAEGREHGSGRRGPASGARRTGRRDRLRDLPPHRAGLRGAPREKELGHDGRGDRLRTIAAPQLWARGRHLALGYHHGGPARARGCQGKHRHGRGHGGPRLAGRVVRRRHDRAGLRKRAVGRSDALCDHGARSVARTHRRWARSRDRRRGGSARQGAAGGALGVQAVRLPGATLDRGPRERGGAQAARSGLRVD